MGNALKVLLAYSRYSRSIVAREKNRDARVSQSMTFMDIISLSAGSFGEKN
jgi:hypothetical protein